MFLLAARKKFRFASPAGLNLTVEDLFDLPLETVRSNRASLNNVAQACHVAVQATAETSFVSVQPKSNADDVAKLDIVKAIIAIRLAESLKLTTEMSDRHHNDKIDRLIDKKLDAERETLSVEELLKQKR